LNELTKKKKHSLNNPQNLKTGDLLINSHGQILKVGKVFKKKCELLFESNQKWSGYGTYDFEQKYQIKKYIKLEKSLKEYEKDLVELILNGPKQDNLTSSCTDLMVLDGKQAYAAIDRVTRQRNEMQILERIMESKKDKLNTTVDNLKDQINSIMKVIGIIELYMGVNEEITQIQEGPKASQDTPISFRQLVLHMDEEVAITDEQGLDFTQLKVFDEWMRNNYKEILPENKGVLIARPRREKKDYGEDVLINIIMNAGNFSTYVLIRNGDNLYRIATNHNIYPYLFPSETEMERLHQVVGGETDAWGSDIKHAESDIFKYKRNVLLLQGLIDRTDIFAPVPNNLNLLKPSTWKDKVHFIYDGTGILDDGEEDFFKWQEKTNKTINKGSRIYFNGFPWNDSRKERMAETGWYDSNAEKKYFPRPDKGIYNITRVEEYQTKYFKTKIERMIFLFKPNDTIWDKNFESHERKRANTYYVYKEDKCILNYDEIDLDRINYYLKSRASKRYYLKILPLLRGIKKLLLEERRWENEFKKLLRTMIKNVSEDQIDAAIKWWKYKIIVKRPLKAEDAKALRMILGRLKKKN